MQSKAHEITQNNAASPNPVPRAPERPLPSVPFYAVEYPGYVLPTSVPVAMRKLGGQSSLDAAFKRAASKTEALVELNLRPGNPFAHPIPGEVVATNNILLKVVKKKRKRKSVEQHHESMDDGAIGEYTAEAVGVIPKTVRFRSMVDYQYQPDINDPVTKLRLAMDNMDVEALCTYTIPEENADYVTPVDIVPRNVDSNFDMNIDPQLTEHPQPEQLLGQQQPSTPLSTANTTQHSGDLFMKSNLRLFPPPLFSRQAVPLAYNFKANPASMVSTSVDQETGEEKKRLINKMRWKGYGPASILFVDNNVPDKPPQAVEDVRAQADQDALKRLQILFTERPIWTRMSLLNQFTQGEARDILNSKVLLPLVCYVFQDGPWRDTLVRFSYDPRKDANARFYQRLYFRNANHPMARPSVITRRQDRTAANVQSRALEKGTEKEADRRKSHIFDGQTLTKETAAFQLCDIVDPMLKEMIEDTDDLRETCNERDGWYTTYAFERIKTVLRHKFFSLLDGRPATDEECAALLVVQEGSTRAASSSRTHKLRAGKHNMAKGALRPEDAAAVRLRAALDRNAKKNVNR